MRRARPRSSRVLLVLSIALAALATVGLRGHLARLEARAGVGGGSGPVVVARSDLERGTAVGPSMLGVRSIPGRYRPPGALTAPGQALGRVLATDVLDGEAITEARLAPPGGPVAALVPEGLRAYPLPAAFPSGSLSPGDRVDVLATYPAGQPYTETVASAAEVLLVLEGGQTPEGFGITVVLLVGPETAERLAHAAAFAEISLAVAPGRVVAP
jgi:pilus assembly protein CpaB